MGTTVLPVLIRDPGQPSDPGTGMGAWDEGFVLDPYSRGLAVAYTFGPPFGTRLVCWDDLADLDLAHRALRHRAEDSLQAMLGSARLYGTGPMYQISFHGVESSLLLADAFWAGLAVDTPGEIVVGAPARDVLCVTGSHSAAGVAKAWRCVDRVFFAGGPDLLLRELLVWRDGWTSLDTAEATMTLPAVPATQPAASPVESRDTVARAGVPPYLPVQRRQPARHYA